MTGRRHTPKSIGALMCLQSQGQTEYLQQQALGPSQATRSSTKLPSQSLTVPSKETVANCCCDGCATSAATFRPCGGSTQEDRT
eukprot:m.124559 g.124559  ORF g.124559 m.124559 type:complete len:84 (-) comp15711_c0_seq1:1320-1571(-)